MIPAPYDRATELQDADQRRQAFVAECERIADSIEREIGYRLKQLTDAQKDLVMELLREKL